MKSFVYHLSVSGHLLPPTESNFLRYGGAYGLCSQFKSVFRRNLLNKFKKKQLDHTNEPIWLSGIKLGVNGVLSLNKN